jgi:putative transposase
MMKCIKIKIIKPIDTNWDTLGKILRDLRYFSSKILNYTIQKNYEWHIEQQKIKHETGNYPKYKDLNECSLETSIYRDSRIIYNAIGSANVNQIVQAGCKKWKSDKKEIMSLQRSIPSYKLNVPIFIYSKSYKIENDDDNYILSCGLLSKKYAEENNLNTQYKILLNVRDNSTKSILDRLASGEYKYGNGQIIYNKRKKDWFFIIPYEIIEKKSTNESVMGIDLGIKYPLYVAFNNSLYRYKIDGGEIEQFRKQIERRKKQLLQQGKQCGDGRKGHGILCRNKPVNFASDRVSNFRNTTNHKYSDFVVKMAIKHNVGLIQMEKLEGITEENIFFKNWSYFDLQRKINNKAMASGIKCEYIDPYKTSQRCSECGHIDKDNRKDQSTFICVKCGFEVNADYNAAKNISTPDIEKIIKEKCKELGIIDERKLKKNKKAKKIKVS